MKKRTKGLVMFAFLGGIMVSSGVLIAIPGTIPNELQPMEDTITGTPADSFPDAQRQQFCSTGGPQSGRYVTEYEIPTACTQPLAIKVDPQGTVWFAQTNTGNIANFEPSTGTFTEFENEAWPESGRSMIWGMDYSPDGSMWYTDEAYDTIWRFSILDEEYSRIAYSDTDTFPQKIEVDGSSLIINDFTGARISFIEQITQKGASSQFMSIPSPLEESFASDFALDGDHIWYTNWVFGGQGVLVSFNHKEYETKSVENPSFDEYIKAVDLPEKTQTPNGLTVDSNGFVWIADTSSSSLYQFDKQTESFTEYMTLPPPVSSYGNATGLVLSPVSRPYWLEAYGDLVIFNEQTGNRIGVLNPTESRLVEYAIPSANPNWADCGIALNCGLAQVFGFDISDQKVWFTEWVENNIGVLDLSLDLPIDIKFDPEEIKITKGESVIITATISAIGDTAERVKISHNVPQEGIILEYDKDAFTVKEHETVKIQISVDETVPTGTYKVIIGADTGDVAVSSYVDIDFDNELYFEEDYQVMPPLGWTYDYHEGSGWFIPAESESVNKATIAIYTDDLDGFKLWASLPKNIKLTLDEFIEEYTYTYKLSLPAFEIINQTPVKIDGLDAMTVSSYVTNHQNNDLKCIWTITIHNNNYYNLEYCTSSERYFDKYFDDYVNFVSTFTFTSS